MTLICEWTGGAPVRAIPHLQQSAKTGLTIIRIVVQMVLMIICVCNRINCKSVRTAVDAGARSPKAVQAHHGCKFQCGKCSCSIGEIISEEMDQRPAAPALVAAE